MKITKEIMRYKLFEHAAKGKYGDYFYSYTNAYDANLTVCPECRVDDFCHVEGCSVMKLKMKNIKFVSAYKI